MYQMNAPIHPCNSIHLPFIKSKKKEMISCVFIRTEHQPAETYELQDTDHRRISYMTEQ